VNRQEKQRVTGSERPNADHPRNATYFSRSCVLRLRERARDLGNGGPRANPGKQHVMAKKAGRSYSLSPFRRLVTDLMNCHQQVPTATVDRRMDLAALVAARQGCTPRPSWAAVFAKAYALVARSYPELRRSYMAFPWARLYEHPSSTAAINVERQLPNEAVVTQCLIRRPDNRSLTEMDGIVRAFQDEPPERLRWYRRAVAMSKVPWPIRPLVWRGALNVSGRCRCHHFGTFGLSSVAAQGAGLLQVIPVPTSMLHYGLFNQAGDLDVRLTWDHRVMDGAVTARILVELERTLQGEILVELTRMSWWPRRDAVAA
jgi:hypothetical protein